MTLLKCMPVNLVLIKVYSKRLFGETFTFIPNQKGFSKVPKPRPRSHCLYSLYWRTFGQFMRQFLKGVFTVFISVCDLYK